MKRRNIYSGSPFEAQIGFSRAVRIGSIVAVAGTAPIAPGGATACPGDAYGQARRCLEIIEKAVTEAGGRLTDIIRTRIYVTDMSRWEEIGHAHSEFFSDIRPVSTLVEVKGLARPDWLVEIEADCLISE
ncbi:MAG: RidA family protein [candidate division Zixibacteria bacterium]|nr:RidA family protein [candidate division Zixibacteria bacterium]